MVIRWVVGYSRCPRTQAQDGAIGGVNFDSNDRFCLDGQRLIAISGADGADGTEYRTELESYSRIISYGTAGSGPAYFKVWAKSGQIMEFGVTADSRIEAQGKASVLVWALDKVQDTVGNYFTLTYTEDNANGQYYPSRIDYTANTAKGLAPYNSVQFIYETRPDINTSYLAGSMIKSTVRLKNLQIFAGTALVNDYRITYEASTATGRSRLTGLTQCAGDGVCLPGTTFTWSNTPTGFQALRWETQAGAYSDSQKWYVADVNGDGRADLVNIFNENGNMSVDVHINTGTGFQIQRWETMAGQYWDAQYWYVVDVNADGRPDLVNIFNDNNYVSVDVHINTGTSFQMQRWETKSIYYSTYPYSQWFLADVNGDGRVDLVNIRSSPNFAVNSLRLVH